MELSTLAIVWVLFRGLTSIIPLTSLVNIKEKRVKTISTIALLLLLLLSTVLETIIINAMGWLGIGCALALELLSIIAVYYSIFIFLNHIGNYSTEDDLKIWDGLESIINRSINNQKDDNEKI